jgi:hypothetical protein
VVKALVKQDVEENVKTAMDKCGMPLNTIVLALNYFYRVTGEPPQQRSESWFKSRWMNSQSPTREWDPLKKLTDVMKLMPYWPRSESDTPLNDLTLNEVWLVCINLADKTLNDVSLKKPDFMHQFPKVFEHDQDRNGPNSSERRAFFSIWRQVSSEL